MLKFRMPYLVGLLISTLSLLLMLACKEPANVKVHNLEEFDSLQRGMPESVIVEKFGPPAKVVDDDLINGIKTISYRVKDSDPSTKTYVALRLRHGLLVERLVERAWGQ